MFSSYKTLYFMTSYVRAYELRSNEGRDQQETGPLDEGPAHGPSDEDECLTDDADLEIQGCR